MGDFHGTGLEVAYFTSVLIPLAIISVWPHLTVKDAEKYGPFAQKLKIK